MAITPSVEQRSVAFHHARAADQGGLDLITVMDHPYNAELLETWTLLTALGMATELAHLLGKVLSTPLRPRLERSLTPPENPRAQPAPR